MSAPDSVVVRVPASTSNCGAGFDTIGLALNLYNRVTVARSDGSGPVPERPADSRAKEMAGEAAAAFSRETGRRMPGFRFRIEGDVPPARGLGSSVTVLAGVPRRARRHSWHGARPTALVGLVAAIEGHPDNAGAGSWAASASPGPTPRRGPTWTRSASRFPGSVAFVVVSPPVELVTKESRGALPATLPFFDAVRSVNSAAYLVAAFASRDFAQLRNVSGDFIHEPYRLPQIPGGRGAIAAGVAAGAWTGWLSGSGSSVLCVCEQAKAGAVYAAMTAAFAQASMPSEGRILRPTTRASRSRAERSGLLSLFPENRRVVSRPDASGRPRPAGAIRRASEGAA
jgi:homoserine kinase